MDYGLTLPMRGPLAYPEAIRAIAERGEALGFRWLAMPDHILVPRSIDSRYPYSGTGAFPGRESGDCLEQLTVLAWVGAMTRRIRLLTSVMVVPHRKPVHTAKILATADVLTGGRVTIGVGAGWMEEEFEAVGTEPFAERGMVTDEYLEIFRALWTQETPRFAGRYASFADISFLPRPVQQPYPPIWVGGESPASLRRAARVGDAWFPIGSNPRHPLDTLARFTAMRDRFHGMVEAAGRDPADVVTAYFANWYREDVAITLDGGVRHLISGGATDVVEDIGGLGEAGVRHLVLNFQRDSLEATLEAMERFAAEVMAEV